MTRWHSGYSARWRSNRTGSGGSVTGYDDTADSLYFQPPLTTVAQNFDCWETGGGAADPADGGAAVPIRELLPTRLIVRQSAWPREGIRAIR
jgi:DNA-binding LacI/PurR family transcriptional regulator